ncbi:thiamine phosphate synthase [Vibrio mimicus]|uniref:thiamine phosphate synthase n=1 Tax=Vibrio mimicus TaxID=674 RepID=UPI0011D9BB16|nr:thiamine phosphate synthase [Vibrio mimicus]TXY00470.1 thiamine phosphate synthase [Vibrio mimicus]
MTRLVFPRSSVELIGRVQYVLLQAKEQGFDIQNISLDVATSDCFVLEAESTLLIDCDLCPCEGTSELLDYYLQYLPEHRDIEARCKVKIGLRSHCDLGVDEWQVEENSCQRITYPYPSLISNCQLDQHVAWVLAMLALSFPIEDALCVARAAVSQKQDVSRETWPINLESFPSVHSGSELQSTKGFPAIDKSQFTLYPVVDDVSWIELLLKLGVKTVQLRIKDPMQVDLEEQIVRSIDLGREYNAQVFINDYWQLAIKHKAYGVHLGQEDLTTANLTELAQAGLRLGLSTHGYYELLNVACLQPSYIALGHIFPTTTKQMPSKPQGLVRLAAYQGLANQLSYHGQKGMPTVAIGGIDHSNIEEVLRRGVTSAAVVRAITQSANPALAVHQLMFAFSGQKESELRKQAKSYNMEWEASNVE